MPSSTSESEDERPMFSQEEIIAIEKEHEARRDAALKKHLDSRAHCLPRFILIRAQDPEHPITKLSPFVIQKAVAGAVGTVKSVRKMYRPYPHLLME